MNTLQQGGTSPFERDCHRCFVMYGISQFWAAILLSGFISVLPSLDARELEDFAQVYVNEFHEPSESVLLSNEGKNRSQALAHYALGRGLENQGQTERAIASYLKVLELQPGHHVLARKTAYLLAQSGQQEAGRHLLEGILTKNPGEVYAHIALSEYLATYHSGDPAVHERSIKVIEQAVEEFPDEAAVYEHIVKLHLAANRKEEARAILQKAISRENKDSVYWLRMGKLAQGLWPLRPESGDFEKKRLNDIYQKALKLRRRGSRQTRKRG